MIMICNVPDEVVKSVKMGTWCGSSVAEKMIANGIPLDKIRAEIEQNAYPIVYGVNNHELGMTLYGILQIFDKYKAESEE